ncbi:hypothetical protein C6341_g23886 [Phytophthora cactorum]|nr:hypothetical protein C6341_g23886 [Phytophthora cactorum]
MVACIFAFSSATAFALSSELDGGTKISQGHEASAFTRRSSHGQYGLLVNVYYVYTKDFRKLSRLMKQIFQCRTPFMRSK